MDIEIPLSLTPEQAAVGVGLTIQLPSGPAHVDVPPGVRNGDLVRVPGAPGTPSVVLRIDVAGAPAPVRRSGALGGLVTLGVVGAVIATLVLTAGGEDGTEPTAGPAYGSSYDPSPSYGSSYEPSYDPEPSEQPTTEEPPDPFDTGTCLNGRLPDSETAQTVSDVEEVSCNAADAHYKVIQTFPFTSDMNRCRSNPRTQYAFSYRYTMNGATINEYVYCLVGLGSYAR
ncbi:LppU/SCO3897 family protein [Streptomyces tritici]|uniref:LppU/SCO3897 family protein n=1 Tax=Streptomyces tritici TaxID=2054410 RepID=UPI003AF14FE1